MTSGFRAAVLTCSVVQVAQATGVLQNTWPPGEPKSFPADVAGFRIDQ